MRDNFLNQMLNFLLASLIDWLIDWLVVIWLLHLIISTWSYSHKHWSESLKPGIAVLRNSFRRKYISIICKTINVGDTWDVIFCYNRAAENLPQTIFLARVCSFYFLIQSNHFTGSLEHVWHLLIIHQLMLINPSWLCDWIPLEDNVSWITVVHVVWTIF